jgi:hypothetical protein
MLSMVAQLSVPGWQMVTLVVSMLRVRRGAAVTTIGCTLGVFDCATAVPFGLDAAVGADATGALAAPELLAGVVAAWPPPLPPPHAVRAAQTSSRRGSERLSFMAST